MSSAIVEIRKENEASVSSNEIRANDYDEDDVLSVIAEDNDVSKMSTSKEQKLSLRFILGLALKRRLKSFAQEVSVGFAIYLVKYASSASDSTARKRLWTFLLLFGIGFMMFQFCDRISFYLSYPTIAHYQIAYNRSLPFPAVTICPESRISRKRILPLIG